jgi:hypothetical protein
MGRGESISLLAKWMPSINTSSQATVKRGRRMAKLLGMSEKHYRKTLSKFRRHLDVVERKMSEKKWGEIKYEGVPSKANLLYKNAFLKQDCDRRNAYLEALQNGETKINAGVLFPHEIAHKYSSSRTVDPTLEELWKALPNVVDPSSRTIVVADGSGSMEMCSVSNSGLTPLTIANALAIYFSERLVGDFANKYITFSSSPQLVDFSGCKTLMEKLAYARAYCEVSNTNVERVFLLILETAINGHMKQEEMPANILIISDMEFDDSNAISHADERLFQIIARKYAEAGYKLPRLVFWNVANRSGFIPVIENELGVALVSGFSVHVAKMVMSGQLDPFECLKEQLMSPRYEMIKAV